MAGVLLRPGCLRVCAASIFIIYVNEMQFYVLEISKIGLSVAVTWTFDVHRIMLEVIPMAKYLANLQHK